MQPVSLAIVNPFSATNGQIDSYYMPKEWKKSKDLLSVAAKMEGRQGIVTCGYSGQFPGCQSADFECFMCASLLTEFIISTQNLTPLSTDC